MSDSSGSFCWHCVWVMFGVDPELNDYALDPPNPEVIYQGQRPCAGCAAAMFTGEGRAVFDVASL